MKKVLVSFLLIISLSVIASVQSGNVISADLINKILNIEVSTGENTCGATFVLSNGNYVLNNSSCSNTVSLSTTASAGHLNLYYDNLSNIPSIIMNVYHHGGVSAFASATFRSSPTNQSTGYYIASASNTYDPSYVHVIIERMGSDRFPRKTIKQIILDLVPNYFN